VDSSTAALLAMDFMSTSCTQTGRPSCTASLPSVNALLKKAHDAKMTVIYTKVGAGTIVPEVTAPQASDITINSTGPDKFLGTSLEDQLKQKKATTLVLTGTAANGAVLFTGSQATLRGFTVVVATDGISSATPFNTFLASYQLLQFPANPDNKPLAEKAVTLSRSDLITFK